MTRLGRPATSRLGVAAHARAMEYRHSNKTVGQIGRELRVDYVLQGSVRRNAHHVRVTAEELIRASDQSRVWGDDFDHEASDPLALESDVAGAIAAEVKATLFPHTDRAGAR